MQGSSRGALAASQLGLRGRPADGADGTVLGDSSSPSAALDRRRAAASPTPRDGTAKAALADRLFGAGSVRRAQVVSTVVQQRWASSAISPTPSILAVQAVPRGGRATRPCRPGRGQIFRFERLVAATPQLRDVLDQPSRAAKAEVVATCSTARQPRRRCAWPARPSSPPADVGSLAVVDLMYLDIASTRRRARRLTATVTSAVDLDPQQRDRMAAALGSIYGRTIPASTPSSMRR